MTQVDPGIQSDAPPWLVDFLLTPPLWFKALLFIAAGLTLALAARRVYGRDLYISLDEQREMLLIVGTVEAIAVGVIAATELLSFGYIGNVAVGLVSGFVAVEVARRLDVLLPDTLAEERAQIAVAWAVIAVGAFVFPELVAVGDTVVPGGLDIALGGVGFAMFFWTVMQEYGPGETVGDVVRASE